MGTIVGTKRSQLPGSIRVLKGRKEVVKANAEKQGESLNAFVVRAIDETIERDSQ